MRSRGGKISSKSTSRISDTNFHILWIGTSDSYLHFYKGIDFSLRVEVREPGTATHRRHQSCMLAVGNMALRDDIQLGPNVLARNRVRTELQMAAEMHARET